METKREGKYWTLDRDKSRNVYLDMKVDGEREGSERRSHMTDHRRKEYKKEVCGSSQETLYM